MMSLTKSGNLEIVDYLLSAEREGYEVTRVTERYPDLTIDDAYSLQRQLIRRKVQDGVKRVGVKLGLTSKAKQEMMGVHEAIYGYLTSDMLGFEWEPIAFNQLIHPKAEPEIAF